MAAAGALAQVALGVVRGVPRGAQLARMSEDSDTSLPSRVSIFLMTMARDLVRDELSGAGGDTA